MASKAALADGADGITPSTVHAEYRKRRMDEWPDDRLIGAAAAVLAPPRFAPADSFVLHAPLELLARASLLPHVRLDRREQARERVIWLAAEYAAAGDSVLAPAAASFGSPQAAADMLRAALAAGDLDDVDRIASWLGAHATPLELRRLLATSVITSLAAAGHAPILLWLMPRVAVRGPHAGGLIRGPLREVARQPGWQLRWFDHHEQDHAGADAPHTLLEALLDVPQLGVPGSTFIFPLMHQAEESGLAARRLSSLIDAPIDVAHVRRELARVAAWSMLQESPEHAPYGWTHCLTMPQAVMGIADEGAHPRVALAVAGTYVVGFRAAIGTGRLVPSFAPEPVMTGDLSGAIDAGPTSAAAAVWHMQDPELDTAGAEIATRASLHHDAHFVKYTLACLDAERADPGARRLMLAAAASLAGWWAQHPDDGFFA